MRYSVSLILLVLLPFYVLAKTISPLNYGLQHAKTGEERYRVLYQTHEIAKKNNWSVSYKGIPELRIEIPSNAKSIPLSKETNFFGAVITVTNTKKKNFFLFELSQDVRSVSVSKHFFSSYDFRSIKELRQGSKLLIIEDKNPWVENRKGYNYGAIRKDVLLLKNGIALNHTISTYDNNSSSPSCQYVEVDNEQKAIRNITLKRTKESTEKTYLVSVTNMNNVLLQGIRIITPTPVNMVADRAISINNCANIFCKQISFQQTYSLSNKSGYGICMNNVWNSWFDGIESEAAWGIFGNNNINTVHISNSKINRFDVHSYGRDFYIDNCEFTLHGLVESSFFGQLEFNKCVFKSAYLCTARTDYNTYTPFNIIAKDCVFYLDKNHRCLINLGNVSSSINSRNELRQKKSPNVSIINSSVFLADNIPNWSLLRVEPDSTEYPFDMLGDINVDGLRTKGFKSDFKIFSRPVRSRNSISLILKGIDLFEDESDYLLLAQKKKEYNPTIVFNVNKDGNDTYYILDSRLNYSPVEFPHYNLHFSNCVLGRIRHFNAKDSKVTTRRKFNECVFYLNDIDSEHYTLDDNADYIRCFFKPVDKKKKVLPFSVRNTSEIVFENCSSEVSNLFEPKVLKNNNILKSYRYKF